MVEGRLVARVWRSKGAESQQVSRPGGHEVQREESMEYLKLGRRGLNLD